MTPALLRRLRLDAVELARLLVDVDLDSASLDIRLTRAHDQAASIVASLARHLDDGEQL